VRSDIAARWSNRTTDASGGRHCFDVGGSPLQSEYRVECGLRAKVAESLQMPPIDLLDIGPVRQNLSDVSNVKNPVRLRRGEGATCAGRWKENPARGMV